MVSDLADRLQPQTQDSARETLRARKEGKMALPRYRPNKTDAENEAGAKDLIHWALKTPRNKPLTGDDREKAIGLLANALADEANKLRGGETE